MHGICLEYSRHKLEMTRKEYVRHILDILVYLVLVWARKWVDIFQVYVGIFQTYWYRPSGQIYGIFQEYVRISNFYGFQMLDRYLLMAVVITGRRKAQYSSSQETLDKCRKLQS
jgi:hypothetical protein